MFEGERLDSMSVTNPESGTTSYTYDNADNLRTEIDAAGNLLAVGNGTLANYLNFDTKNQLTKVSAAAALGGGFVNYIYDAQNQRVMKAFSDNSTTIYVYDAFGQLAAEYSNPAELIAPACGVCYLSTDHLGSIRMVTDSGAHVIARHDFLPFGEEIPAGAAGRTYEWGSRRQRRPAVHRQRTGSGIRPRLLRRQILRLRAGTVDESGRSPDRSGSNKSAELESLQLRIE
jgi:YD repeat-containing protein